MDAAPTARRRLSLAFAGFTGSALEFYDFFIYGTAAALVFGKLFFPGSSPLAGTLLSFATFAVGFAARPLGAVLFGQLGDRVGRRTSLIWSISVMGVATFLIGCLPTYSSIGIGAPLLLVFLRVAQGIALGGEWGGASLMLVEHAPQRRRSLYGSVVQMGAPAGLILSSLAVNASGAISGDAFNTWGWRLPFLASAILLGVSLFVRLRLEETPVFTALEHNNRVTKAPLRVLFRTQWRDILLAVGVVGPGAVLFYLISTYAVAYGTQSAGFDRTTLLNTVLLASIVYLVTIPLAGLLSDILSSRAVLLFGCAITIPSSYLLFTGLDTGRTLPAFLGITFALAIAHAALQAPQPAFFTSRFAPSVRFSGVAFSQAVSSSLMSGTAPLLATAFYASTGSTLLINGYVAIWGVLGAVAVLLLCRRAPATPSTEPAEPVSTPAHGSAVLD